MNIKRTVLLRQLLIFIIIVTFITLCGIFISQYKQYKEVEDRLNLAYNNNSKLSPLTYKLFSTFSEADNLFRLYAISFDDANFKAYQDKLDTLKSLIVQIDSIPSDSNKTTLNINPDILDQELGLQFIVLKKKLDNLISFADEKLPELDAKGQNSPTLKRLTNSDSVINKILKDTINRIAQDTLIKKKEGLFKRIFNTKADTILNNKNLAVLNINQIDVVQRNIDNLIKNNESAYSRNYNNLRQLYLASKEKERSLITSNYQLLNELKSSIDTIRTIEINSLRMKEKSDYLLYSNNTSKFRNYANGALIVILLLLIFIIYYQYVVSKYEKKLIEEKEYAASIADEKTNLLANISHEIRTPLISLQGVIKLMNDDKKKLNEIDPFILNNIDNDICVINNTVNDILNLGKIESGAMEVSMDKVDLNKIILECYDLNKFSADSKGLLLINENNLPSEFLINSNEFRLRQIISNLISNAIKYTQKGSVKIVTNANKNNITINVVDTGIGIDPKNVDQIFRKYYTVDKQDKSKKLSFGLGLHISQLLASQIDGKLSVKSQLGVGSTFTFEFPRTTLKANKSIKSNIEKSRKGNLLEKSNIVIIDDNKITLMVAKQKFKDFDQTKIHTFDSSSEAFEYLKNNIVDIVITDIIMPKITGWDILEQIRQDENHKFTKVYACTAEDSLIIQQKDKIYSFDGILDKNYNLEELSRIHNV